LYISFYNAPHAGNKLLVPSEVEGSYMPLKKLIITER
jgi:hypothetical protein